MGPPSVEAVTALIVASTALVTAVTALYHALKGDEGGSTGLGESEQRKVD